MSETNPGVGTAAPEAADLAIRSWHTTDPAHEPAKVEDAEEPADKPADPDGDDGLDWSRERIETVIGAIALAQTDDDADQLRALLADRDQAVVLLDNTERHLARMKEERDQALQDLWTEQQATTAAVTRAEAAEARWHRWAQNASARLDAAVLGPTGEHWRVGTRVGRTVYRVTPDDEQGTLIGVMDTVALAELAVDAVNRARYGGDDG